MKASAIAYGGILVILILVTFIFMELTASENVDRTIVSVEGKLISFVNTADLLIKTFNESIYFISQRAAYDLGKTGGMEGSQIAIWNENYPTMDDLEAELENRIKENLPNKEIKNDITITWGEGEIDTEIINLEDSISFLVRGNKPITIYDESITSRISVNHEINHLIDSNYFKLLKAGRAIMEDPQFNKYLNDYGALLNELYKAKAAGDSRFVDLIFSGSADGDIVELTIKEDCYSSFYLTYCLAPLKPGEIGSFDPSILYDYVELRFKYQEEQTNFTSPSGCGNGDIDAGEQCDPPQISSNQCSCPEDGCMGQDYYDYPSYGRCTALCTCNIGTGSGQPCQPVINYSDPRCPVCGPSTQRTTERCYLYFIRDECWINPCCYWFESCLNRYCDQVEELASCESCGCTLS